MSELFEYGVRSSDDTYGLVPTDSVPPIAKFETGMDLLYSKIITVIDQKVNSLFYDRSLGCDIDEYVFETANDDTVKQVKQAIHDALIKNIENINVSNIDVKQKVMVDGYVEYDVEITVNLNEKSYMISFKLTKSGVQQ